MNRVLLKNKIIILILMTISMLNVGCQSYIEFEKMRFKFIFYFIVITTIIGVIYFIFKKDE